MEKLEIFLDIFLTIAEKESIINRYLIIKELLEHHPHREIAKCLNVSIANVSRGSNVLKTKRIEIEQLFHMPISN